MNLTDRIYLALHLALTVLVAARYDRVPHWPLYILWNAVAIAAILFFARKQNAGVAWEFAHDWLPAAVLFTSVFEEASFLSLALVGHWQSQHLIAFESWLFAVSPAAWLHRHVPSWAVEFLEFGYFAFYPMYPIVGLNFWFRRRRPAYARAFRSFTDALSVGYLLCYATYILWPTQSPRHAQGLVSPHGHGPFHWLVGLIQGSAGVHGNAFPSGHIMLAFVTLIFVWRYLPRATPWLLIINVLMCLGAVYDGYHYASDALAGALLGLAVGMAFLLASHNRPASPPS